MRWCFFLVLMLSTAYFTRLSAQGVSGSVKSTHSEVLPYAAFLITPGNHSGITNEQGRFEMKLPPGNYTIQVHFMGYQGVKKEFSVAAAFTRLDIQLDRQVFELAEVKVKASNEDPAYDMMRQAIAKAPLHRAVVQSYAARSYVKGTMLVKKAPWAVRKLMESEKFKVGTTYVMESVSTLNYVQPATFSEKVISLRSNLPPAVNSQISFASYSFYNVQVAGMTSPLAPNALRIYRFKFQGSKQEGDKRIVKIEVKPRVPGPGVVDGVLYLVYGDWNIHSLELNYIDSEGYPYKFIQQYQQSDDLWMPTKLDITVQITYLGAVADIRYLTSVRDYKVTPNTAMLARLSKQTAAPEIEVDKTARKTAKRNNREIEKQRDDTLSINEALIDYRFDIDTLARLQPDSVWDELRQVPLEEMEILGYRQSDSMYVAEYEKMKREAQGPARFKVKDVVMGYRYHKGRKIEDRIYPYSFQYYGLLSSFAPNLDFFNAVEGFAFNTGIIVTNATGVDKRKSTELLLRYSFGRQKILPRITHERVYEGGKLRIGAGLVHTQFNAAEPIHPGMNMLYTFVGNQHLMPLYQKAYLQLEWQHRFAPTWSFESSLEFAQRTALPLSDRLWVYPDNLRFGSNAPANSGSFNTAFFRHNLVRLQYALLWRPGARLARYNGREYVRERNIPTFRLEAIGGLTGSPTTPFLKSSLGVEQRKGLGQGRALSYQLSVGTFLRKPVYFPDFHHFDGNQTIFMGRLPFRFRSLDYYQHSTTGTYTQFFSSYNTRRLLFTQFEVMRQLGLDELLFCNAMTTATFQYIETGYRLDGIARLLGVDVFAGFSPAAQPQFGLRLKVDF
jgi:hypothetical protein